jgi:hypothetical protein
MAARHHPRREGRRVIAPFPDPPRLVLLFSGHRVDAPGREPPRFPAGKVAAAGAAIEGVLDGRGAGAGDLALTQGSAGGDLLFAEACLRRGVHLRLLLPLAEAAFVRASVEPSADGEHWVERFRAVRAALEEPPRVLDAAAGADGGDRFERCNAWLLETALAWGAERLRFICLWDGGPSDGPGGTGQLVEAVRRLGRPMIQVDARSL